MRSVPLYIEVKNKLVTALADGEWKAGDKVPIESDLARRFGVGVSTVRAAVGALETVGVLSRRQGKGTYVADHASERTIDRFFNLVRADGVRVTPTRDLITLRRGRASPVEHASLQLFRYSDASYVHRIRTTFSLEGRCIGVSDVVVPAALFPGLTRADIIDGSVALYALYQSNHNINVISVTADLTAELVPKDVAPLIGLRAGEPVLRINRKACTYHAVPVELRTSWVKTGDYKFHVSQNQSI